MVRQMLERCNHEVIEAANGAVGIEVYENSPTDLIITDLIMPKKDGLMAIQEVLSKFPLARVIAMSGGAAGNAAWLPIAKRIGALRLLKKPFTKEKLI